MKNKPLTFRELVKEIEDEKWVTAPRCTQEQWPIPGWGWRSWHIIKADSKMLSKALGVRSEGFRRLLLTKDGAIWPSDKYNNYYGLRLVTQSCQTLCDLMDCSAPGSFVHGIPQARILLQVIFLTQGSNPCLLHWQAGSLPLHHQWVGLYQPSWNPWVENDAFKSPALVIFGGCLLFWKAAMFTTIPPIIIILKNA